MPGPAAQGSAARQSTGQPIAAGAQPRYTRPARGRYDQGERSPGGAAGITCHTTPVIGVTTGPPTARPPAPSATVTAAPASTPTPRPSTVAAPSATPAIGVSHLNPVGHEVTYRVVAHSDGLKLDRILVYEALPVEWDAQDQVRIEEVNLPATSKKADSATGNGFLGCDVKGKPAKGKDVDLVVRFTFTGCETTTNLQAADVEPYRTGSALYRRYRARRVPHPPALESGAGWAVRLAPRAGGSSARRRTPSPSPATCTSRSG
jgi:hypothetical protein